MGKNVAVFVDVANIFYAAKAAGVDIDYVTLLKAGSAGRDLVRAYAYTGLDPDNENQRNFHDFLRRNGYRVVSKDIRKYGDGKVKANLDIELVVDMMKTARNLDVAIVVSGDGDFAPAIRAVQEMGVRVEVVSFRGNTSSDLMDVADLFTDIVQIAKVEKGSSRSGRRVAGDEADLSMTEVPDKQSEGTGERGRGRGRTRRVAATATTATGRTRSRTVVTPTGDATIVVLPGERLSRVGVPPVAAEAADLDVEDVETELEALPAGGSPDESLEDGRRRRRRRGGRGRGRGRGQEAGFDEAPAASGASADEPLDEDEVEAPRPARRPTSSFGSVWDSQIGIPTAATRGAPVVDDDEDFEEPSVPEYLISERRQRDAGRGGARGGRGRGGAYAAALDRERFGGGRGATVSRFQEPPSRPRDEGRDRGRDVGRGDRPPFRPAARPAPRPSGDEPWSEVPPEIEAMLRAQMGSRPAGDARREPARESGRATRVEPDAVTASSTPAGEMGADAGTPATTRRGAGTRRAASAASGDTASRPAAGRRPRATGTDAAASASTDTGGEVAAEAVASTAAKRSTRTTRTAATKAPTGDAATAAAAQAAAKAPRAAATGSRSRTPKATAGPASDVEPTTAGATAAGAEAPAPKRRVVRKKAEKAEPQA